MRWISGVLLCALTAGSEGCSLVEKVGVLSGTDAGMDAGMDGGLDARELYCAHPGPAWIVDPVTGVDGCGGHVSGRAFRQAVCSLGFIHASASFSTDTLDTLGYPVGPLASVWVGNEFRSMAQTQVGGGLQVDGTSGVTVSTSLSVAGPLRSEGDLKAKPAVVTAGLDVEVAGDISLKSLTAGGLLYQPDGGVFSVDDGFPDSQVRRQPVYPFVPLCPSIIENIDALVRLNSADNHDSLIGLDPGTLEGFSESQRSLTLPCGRFYLSSITGTGDVQLDVTGKTTLFVGGEVSVGSLSVTLEDGAELDLFIRGQWVTQDQLVWNSNGKPSHLRVYIQNGFQALKAYRGEVNLYAPKAALNMSDNLEVSGSLFVQSLVTSGTFFLHFDPDILRVESTCPSGG